MGRIILNRILKKDEMANTHKIVQKLEKGVINVQIL
jgi:hypothetical protein